MNGSNDVTVETKCCLVCSITTKINYHFGSTTCLACASFFRRTVSLGIQYVCNRDGSCSTSHAVRSGCRACRFKRCETAGMKAGLVRGKRDAVKTTSECEQQRIETDNCDYPLLSIETLGVSSPNLCNMENNPSEEQELNTILNVTNEQLMQFYIELNQKQFYPLSQITFDSFSDLERKNNQEATYICQNCPGTDLLDLADLGILFRYVAFSNMWLDGLWSEVQLEVGGQRTLRENTNFQWSEFESADDDGNKRFRNFIASLRENVGNSLKHLNLDIVEYAALKSFCIWKLGIIDFGTTLKIFAHEHYLGVTSALTEYHRTEKSLNEVESALRIANMTLLLGPIFNAYQETMKLHG